MLNDEEELQWLREMNKNERGRFGEGKDYDRLWRKERKFVFIAGKSAGVTFLEVRSGTLMSDVLGRDSNSDS